MMGMNLLLLTHLLLSLAIGIEGFNVRPTKQPTKPLPTLRKDISSFSERELKVTAASSAAELPNFSYASSSSTSATVPSLMTTIKTQVYQYYFGYMRLLQNKPFATSAVSAAVINAIGSVLSQQIMSLVTGKLFRLNLVQVGAFFLTGLIFKGPWYHVWYSWLDRVSGKLAKAETPKNVAIQISLDQTIGVLFFYSTHFYVYELLESIVAMRAPLLGAAHAQCVSQLGAVLTANYFVWPFFQLVNFSYIPAALRVLATNLMGMLWNCYFCAMV